MNNISLNGRWRLGLCTDAELPKKYEITSISDVEKLKMQIIEAQVPGNFELDMEREGLLPNLFFGKNLLMAQELELTHLFYSKIFDLTIEDCQKSLQVVFEGIDTVAEIYLNGFLVGTADNMFLEHVFPMDYLFEGENELFVHVIPVALKAREYEGEMYAHGLKYNYDSLHIRKAAYMWGWDIFPRILSGGIWKEVYVREEKKTEISQAYLFVKELSEDYARADIKLFYDMRLQDQEYKDLEIVLTGKCRDSSFEIRERLWSRTGHLSFSLEHPCLWWPSQKGEQNLYKVEVKLLYQGQTLDERLLKFGVRTVELKRTSLTDEEGSGEFCFLVNHKKLFIKGTNWVPLDSFPSSGKDKIAKALDMVEDIGCNMIRCWGGGYYEYDEFYDICDEKGILIWQDFMMACGHYPQDEEFLNRMRAEAVSVVRRLRQHPCLCLWSGDNECDEYAEWENYANKDPNDNKITRSVIKDVLRRNDYIRPYLPSSPYVDEQAYQGDARYISEIHLWGPRDYFKSDFYTKNPAHFISETGYHGCPAVSSIKRFISEDALWPYRDNAEWLLHASSAEASSAPPYAYRIPLMANQIRVLFGEIPDSLEEFSRYSQISQAEALKFFIERSRSGKWRRTGIIWWNLLDGCPQFSDAVVDYYFVKKLAYSYIKQSQQPICLMFQELPENRLALIGVNDTDEKHSVSYQVQDVLEGKTLLDGTVELMTDSAETIAILDLKQIDQEKGGFLQIRWQEGEREFQNHYAAWNVPFDYERYMQGAKMCGLGGEGAYAG